MTDEKRLEIVNEAKSWVGTPYVGWSALKGSKGGTDCGQLIKAVYQKCGVVPQGDLGIDPCYSLQVAQHLADPTYLSIIETYMKEISVDEVKPGDVVAFKLGHAFAHAGIVIEYPTFIHAMGHGGVRFSNVSTHPKLRKASHRFYTIKDV